MKRIGIAATAVLALALVGIVIGQVAYAEGGQVKRKDFALIGAVLDVDADAATFDVAPESGYWGGGSVVTIHVTPQTRFAPTGVSLLTLDPGDEVRTSGRIVDGDHVAEVVAVSP